MHRKLIVIPLVLVVLILGGFFLLSALINKDKIKNNIVTAFKAETGLDLQIQGSPDLQIFPLPHVVIESVYVTNVPGAAASFLFSIKTLDITPSLGSYFGSVLTISSLKADGVDIDLERMGNNEPNWKALVQSASAPKNPNAGIDILSLAISNATIHYVNTPLASRSDYKNINFILTKTSADHEDVAMNLRYADKPISLSGSIGNPLQLLAAGTIEANIVIKSGNSSASFVGDVGVKNEDAYYKGNVTLAVDDAAPWAKVWQGVTTSNAAPADAESGAKPLPIQAKAEIATQGNIITFSNITLTGTIAGTMQATYTSPAIFDIKGALNTVDMDSVVASGILDGPPATPAPPKADLMQPQAQPVVAAIDNSQMNAFLNALSLTADIKVADTLYNAQHITDSHFIFDMVRGEMSVTQASMLLPGNSRMIFTGLGKEGYQGFALEGQVDAAGDDFNAMLKVLKSKGCSLPEDDFKRFRIRTNVNISKNEIRLSELAARIENIAITGGIVAALDKERPNIEAALNVGGLNIDHVITLWGLPQWETSFLQESQGPRNESFLSSWLRELGFDLRMNASLQQYTLGGGVRDKMDFKMAATQNKIIIDGLNTAYNGSALIGNVALDVSGALPRLDVSFAADTFDFSTFFGLPPAPQTAAATAPRWSADEFNLRWLELFTGTYHFKAGSFKIGDMQAQGLETRGSISDGTLNVDSISGSALGADVAARATVKGGKIPVLNIAANIANLDAQKLVSYFPALDGVLGKYSFNTRLETNGNNLISWVSNLKGGIGISGRDVLVRGFNLPGIVNAVAYVRTVADILNVVKRAFPGGNTLFTTIDGQWTLADGKITLSDTRLTTEESKGTLSGIVDLVNWTTQNQFAFNFPSLDSSNPPSITINFSGDLNAPQKALDTRALEQYVTNKTSQRMLQGSGTQ